MADFVKALDQEISELEQELQADPRHARLEKLRELRRFYGGEAVSLAAKIEASSQTRVRMTVRSEARDKILKAAASIIRGRVTPTSTASILDEVQAQGLEVHGKDARNTLSAMLSNAQEFKTHGRSGWTLVESDQPAKNTEAADGDTPTSDPSTASSRARLDQPRNPVPMWGRPNNGGG